jgi:hypothetical protein
MTDNRRARPAPPGTGDRETRYLLDYAAMSRHYGGGPDDEILVEFGLRTDDFYDRVREAITSGAAVYLGPQVVGQLWAQCRSHLSASDGATRK